jgi:hypothetical protein
MIFYSMNKASVEKISIAGYLKYGKVIFLNSSDQKVTSKVTISQWENAAECFQTADRRSISKGRGGVFYTHLFWNHKIHNFKGI